MLPILLLILLYFSGKGGSAQNDYHVDLEFYSNIVPEVGLLNGIFIYHIFYIRTIFKNIRRI